MKPHSSIRRFAACLLVAVAMLPGIASISAMDLKNLRCEYRDNPLGIDAQKPRLSWIIEERSQRSVDRGQKQTACQVLVASSPELLANDQGDLWDSGKVASDQSIQLEYAGKSLESRAYCHWKVRVWLNDGKASEWGAPAFWSMGLLKPEDWQAKWVKAGGETSPWLRKEFTLAAVPERATAFVNVKGNYELYINGKKVGDDVLMPAVAVYRKRTLYNTYDLSKYLKPGTNCVGVWLGLGLSFIRKNQEHMPIARVQLDMSLAGQRVVVGTDPTWTWMDSSHTEFGWSWCGNGRETIDERRDIDGWNEVGCTNGSWKPVEEFAEPTGVATAQACPPNRITKKFPVVKCTAMTPNMFELDFGTNLNGWFTLKLPKLEAGHKVTIRFADKRLQTAEEEKNSGVWKLNTDHGPTAYTTFNQQLEFISAGKPGEQIWPKHNYFSFQYAIVEGLPAAPTPGDAEALMIESDLESAGTFECSNNLFNRINQVNKSANVLGKTDDAKKFGKRVTDLKTLIHSTYYKENEKLYESGRELDQALPLAMGMVPAAQRANVQKALDDAVMVKNKGHLDTGMLGTYFLLKSLRETGRNDLAFSMANQQDYPGWGYLLSQGMTTFGEQWDGIWSQIHSCFASAGSWFYQGLAGICPDESGPGFKKIIIKPAIVGDLTWVKCGYDSIHGRIVSNWKRDGDKLTMEVSIPINTTATVYVPANDAAGVTESNKPAAEAAGVKFLRMESGAAVYELGSGSYRFQSAVPE
ncbi:MAG: family 78 glycoside hydrolase catalytic domain [Verrucomicrobia bacterium]|nr:family 78 glycoside hydrolase catalytic domain [Verrucomicrobiota bacterium]